VLELSCDFNWGNIYICSKPAMLSTNGSCRHLKGLLMSHYESRDEVCRTFVSTVKSGLFLCFFKHHSMKSYEDLRYSSTHCSPRQEMEVVSFTFRSLYHRGNCPQEQFGRRLGESVSRSESCEEEKNLLPLSGTELRFLSRPTRSLVTLQ
jgi:hypothetical protein